MTQDCTADCAVASNECQMNFKSLSNSLKRNEVAKQILARLVRLTCYRTIMIFKQ